MTSLTFEHLSIAIDGLTSIVDIVNHIEPTESLRETDPVQENPKRSAAWRVFV